MSEFFSMRKEFQIPNSERGHEDNYILKIISLTNLIGKSCPFSFFQRKFPSVFFSGQNSEFLSGS